MNICNPSFTQMKLSFIMTLVALLLACMAVSVSGVDDYALIVAVFQGGSGPEHEVIASTSIRPDEPLRLCVKAADNQDGLYVQSIQNMTWSISTFENSSLPIVNHYQNETLSVLDCSESFGVCCTDFVVDESVFPYLTGSSALTVSGSAILAFSADHRRQLEEAVSNDEASVFEEASVSSGFNASAGFINTTAGILKVAAAEASGAEGLRFLLGVAMTAFVTTITGAVFAI
jgi:hypothetical protein